MVVLGIALGVLAGAYLQRCGGSRPTSSESR